MALFVDGYISSVTDLQGYDSAVLEAARSEGVDLEQKLKVAEQEIAVELTAFLLRHRERTPSRSNGEPDVTGVVATPALKMWHTLRTLTLIYGDVYSNQVNDRFEVKRRHFEQRSKQAADSFFEIGVGLTVDPIGRAFQAEVITGGLGSATMTYSVSVGWRNFRGEKGAPSQPVIVTTVDGEGLLARAVNPPANASGYDVLAGDSTSSMTQQNATPLMAGQWWTLPSSGLIDGPAPSDGQQPDYWVRHERMLRRG